MLCSEVNWHFVRIIFISSSNSSCVSTLQTLKMNIDEEITSKAIVIFSKSYCPYCVATKKAAQQLKAEFIAHELDKMPNGSQIQAELLQKTGQRTVPNVFVNGKHIGGNDDFQAAIKKGEIQKMLSLL